MARFLFLVLMIAAVLFAGWHFLIRKDAPLAPESGAEHPFAQGMGGVSTDRPVTSPRTGATPGSSALGAAEPFVAEENPVTFAATITVNGISRTVSLEATPEVPPEALEYFANMLSVVETDAASLREVPFFAGTPGDLRAGAREIRLPRIGAASLNANNLTAMAGSPVNANATVYAFAWPDGWIMERPYVLRLDPDYFRPAGERRGDPDIDLGIPDPDVGRATAALTGEWSGVDGVLTCDPPDGPAEPLAFVEVIIGEATGFTDAGGAFSIDGDFTDVDSLLVRYDGNIDPVAPATTGPSVSVMNEFHNPRSETIDVASGNTVDGRLDTGALTTTSLDCELFNHGAVVLAEYHSWSGGANPPAPDDLRIKRWRDVYVGTPYSYYDYVVLATNFRTWDGWAGRRDTVRHEFGHTFRHAADGGQSHWDWDNFRWVYARAHSGFEVFNEQYAFNEGFAQYWECTEPGIAAPCLTRTARWPGPLFLDWNELLVAQRLDEMALAAPGGHAAIAMMMRANRGSIHTLFEWEATYCTRFNVAPYCSGGAPTRVKADCPPGFNNDGATCREMNDIVAKQSYTRGTGIPPRNCGADEYDAGLCYEPCRPGFDGVGPVCWQQCPAGMHDDGAFCRRDVQIIASDNSACEWFDVCGLTFDAGCSVCPAGFQNDGCFCRIDAWIFAKPSYGRGVGGVPTECSLLREYDAGLCYRPCRAGFNGVGPVCWGTCPAGYDDHGATCYRPPNILTRF